MAHNFFTSSRVDYYEIIEFLLHRYGTLEEIKKMSFNEFLGFFKMAKEKNQREINYKAWVSCLPFMSKDNFIPFESYNDKCTGKNMDTRPAEEIMAEVEEIRRKVKQNGNIIV